MVSNIISMLMTLNCSYIKVGDAVDLLEGQRGIEMCIARVKKRVKSMDGDVLVKVK